MIKVNFVPPITPQWTRWLTDGQKTAAKHIEDVLSGKAIDISEALYKRRKDVMLEAFFNKCAYCETQFVREKVKVEHYRPKKAVADLNNKSVLLGGRPHPGYYWIAYDWKNLLPACDTCNLCSRRQDGTYVGKGNRFPVQAVHAYDPADPAATNLSAEQPLLLHPYFDEPSDHLAFDPVTGMLSGKTDRGEKTILLVNLNAEHLSEARREAYDDYKRRYIFGLFEVLSKTAGAQKCLEEMREIKEGRKPYAFTYRAALKRAQEEVAIVNNGGAL